MQDRQEERKVLPLDAISLFQGRVEVWSASLAKIQDFTFAGDPVQSKGFGSLSASQQSLCQRLYSTFPDAKEVEMKPGPEGRIIIHRESKEDPSKELLDGLRAAVAAYVALNVTPAEPDEGVLRQLADGLQEL